MASASRALAAALHDAGGKTQRLESMHDLGGLALASPRAELRLDLVLVREPIGHGLRSRTRYGRKGMLDAILRSAAGD